VVAIKSKIKCHYEKLFFGDGVKAYGRGISLIVVIPLI